MSDTLLLSLPVELLHRVFDHLDVQTIFFAVRPVCKQLFLVISSYGRLKLNFISLSLSDLRRVSYIIQPENVISLTTSEGGKKLKRKIHSFFSHFDLNRFTHLHSLNLGRMNNVDIEKFILRIVTTSLISLSIDFSESETVDDKMNDLLSSVIDQSRLRKLQLNNFNCKSNHMLFPMQSALCYLAISSCTYSQYRAILDRCPQLQTFLVKNCYMNDHDEIFSSSSSSACYSQLTSLSISDCPLQIEDLESWLTLTPSLLNLKLVSSRQLFDDVFHGRFWKKLIQIKLPLLINFQFCFTCSFDGNANTPSLESILSPFRAPFWIEEKHWIVTCAYMMDLAQITLYTSPVHTATARYIIGCKASSLNSLHFLSPNSTNDTADISTEWVSSMLMLNEISIGNQGAQYLAEALLNNTTLTSICLRENGIGAQGIQCLTNILQNNTTVTSLIIESNHMGVQEAQCLANILRHNTTLTELLLFENQIGDQGVKSLAEALRNNKTLILLDLTNNQITEQGAQYLAEALQFNVTLTTIYLRVNQITHQGAEHFAGLLRKNTPLATLRLDENQIGDQGAENLAAALRDNTTLTELCLRDNQIEDKGAEHLADALQNNTTLTKLYLEGDQIGALGAQHFASALRINTTLTDLFLAGNRMEDRGIQYLADALRSNTGLLFLHLYGNQIGDEGAQYLADGLRENRTLTQISLETNRIGDEGVQSLAGAIRNNTTLTYLILCDNSFGDKGAECLVDALQTNMTLTTLAVTEEQIGSEIRQRIKDLIQRNLQLNNKN